MTRFTLHACLYRGLRIDLTMMRVDELIET